jgi:acyl carrier protein
LDLGIVDSTGVLDLLMFVEEQFGIEVADDELAPENFDSIDKLADFVERKRRLAGGPPPATE